MIGTIAYALKDYHALFHTKYIAPVLFVHINKTGGSSIEKALGLPFQHRTAREMVRVVGERRWRERFSFAFVRNPWDKVASHYFYRVKTNQTGLGDHHISFSEWVQRSYGDRSLPYYDNPKMFMPQWEWVTNERDELAVDFIGRFENLRNDFEAICARVRRQATLPHLKQSTQGDYRRHYDPATAEIIERWFRKDIQMFGYSFG